MKLLFGFIVVAVLSACENNSVNQGEAYFSFSPIHYSSLFEDPTTESDVTVEITSQNTQFNDLYDFDTFRKAEFQVAVTNHSDQRLELGPSFSTAERYEDGEWVDIEPPEDVAETAVLHYLEPNETQSFPHALEFAFQDDEIRGGTYRVANNDEVTFYYTLSELSLENNP